MWNKRPQEARPSGAALSAMPDALDVGDDGRVGLESSGLAC